MPPLRAGARQIDKYREKENTEIVVVTEGRHRERTRISLQYSKLAEKTPK